MIVTSEWQFALLVLGSALLVLLVFGLSLVESCWKFLLSWEIQLGGWSNGWRDGFLSLELNWPAILLSDYIPICCFCCLLLLMLPLPLGSAAAATVLPAAEGFLFLPFIETLIQLLKLARSMFAKIYVHINWDFLLFL